MKPLRFALFGAGFWARYQLAGWRQVGGTECVAVYNRTRSKAEAFAGEMNIPAVYDDAEALLEREKLDFIDIVTDVGTHPRFVHLAAKRGLPVICQKPMATLAAATEMVEACRKANVPFFVHENWRWQAPLVEVRRLLGEGRIGTVYRARMDMVSAFPVFDNQPFLRELEQFVITDVGNHVLDAARALFGEAKTVYCRTHRVHQNIRGEDVATVVLGMKSDATVVCSMGYAGTPLERDRFPETFLLVEGARGSIAVDPDFWVRVTTAEGTLSRRCPPPRYAWADARYDVVHASIVPCIENILAGLRGTATAETTGTDNLETVRLVFAAYDSARTGQVVTLPAERSGGRT